MEKEMQEEIILKICKREKGKHESEIFICAGTSFGGSGRMV